MASVISRHGGTDGLRCTRTRNALYRRATPRNLPHRAPRWRLDAKRIPALRLVMACVYTSGTPSLAHMHTSLRHATGWRRASTPGLPSTAGLRNPLKTTWSSSRPPRPPSVPAPPTASTAQCRASLACRRQRRFVSWSPHELTARHAAAGPASCVPHARPRRRAARSRSEAPRTARSPRALHARHPVPHNPNQVDGSRPVIFTGALLPVLEAASQ